MEKYPSSVSETFSGARYDESGSRDNVQDQEVYFGSHGVSGESNCWWLRDGEMPDPRQRWSFGSDISVEPDETVQNRLCCSPADEFDSTNSSENDDLIVNCTDEADRSYGAFSGISPVSPPSFKEVEDECSDNHDVDTADDELIDYSKRYTTDCSLGVAQNKQVTQTDSQKNECSARTVTRPVVRRNSVTNRPKLDSYRDYAETDLDQPTDYSLRYAEEGFEREKRNNNTRLLCTNDAEDYVRTYYTEGTPYQTPSIFSAATSVSDLSSLDGTRGEAEEAHQSVLLKKEKSIRQVEQKLVQSNIDQVLCSRPMKQSKIVPAQAARDTKCEKVCGKTLKKPCNLPSVELVREKDVKPVAYFRIESSAQATPLMYSRSSSLDSLSDFEQNLINDDGSSVISDFSHMTSGAVSPSELPDSPTQMVPPSPAKHKQQNFEHDNQNSQKRLTREPVQRTMTHLNLRNDNNNAENESNSRDMVSVKPTSIFEDGLVSFEEESMPVKSHSTRASSLSALTIDDEVDGSNGFDDREIMCRISALKNKNATTGLYQTDKPAQHFKEESRKSDQQVQHTKTCNSHPGSTNSLSTTIRRTIPSKLDDEYSSSNRMLTNKQVLQYTTRDPRDDPISDSDKIKILNEYQTRSRTKQAPTLKSNFNSTASSSQRVNPEDHMKICDSIRTYCTENTPTYISPSGSVSNLSALSIFSEPEENLGGEQYRLPRERERFSSQDGSYCSEEEKLHPDTCGDNYEDGAYDIEEESEHRIDVSPFDSQTNLANFSLLSIEEENEEEGEEEIEEEPSKKMMNYKTDNVTQASDERIYERSSESDQDYVDEEAVLQECIKTGASRFTRQNFYLKNR